MNSGGAASAMDNQSMDPGELLVFLKRCPARPMLPRVGPEYVPVEREGGGCGRLCQLPRPLLGGGTGVSWEVQGDFQAPATSQIVMWLGSGVPHNPGVAHGRPYTRGLSVS